MNAAEFISDSSRAICDGSPGSVVAHLHMRLKELRERIEWCVDGSVDDRVPLLRDLLLESFRHQQAIRKAAAEFTVRSARPDRFLDGQKVRTRHDCNGVFVVREISRVSPTDYFFGCDDCGQSKVFVTTDQLARWAETSTNEVTIVRTAGVPRTMMAGPCWAAIDVPGQERVYAEDGDHPHQPRAAYAEVGTELILRASAALVRGAETVSSEASIRCIVTGNPSDIVTGNPSDTVTVSTGAPPVAARATGVRRVVTD